MRYLICLLTLILFACQNTSNESSDATKDKPNIVLIIADDLSVEAVRALGNPDIQTPHLDQLVQNGTNFTHCYNMGGWNGAICAASRAMLISGRSLWRANDFRQNWRQGKAFDKTWPELMEANGYDTYMTGKWHVDAPADSIFQQAAHIRPGMPSDPWVRPKLFPEASRRGKNLKNPEDMPFGYARPKDRNDTAWSPTDTSNLGFWQGGKHWSEIVKDDAVGFIQQAKQKDNPFFMYLAFNAPHDPRQSPQSYLDLYDVDKLSFPENFQALHPFKDSIGNDEGLRDEALAPFPRTEYAVRKHMQEYYAIITHLDAQVGKIIDALRETGQMDNTYIFFTADHGLAVGKHGLLGKQNMYEHSIRVPFVMTGPNVPKGQAVKTDIYLQDVMPTSLELAGISKPEYVEFHSVADRAFAKSSDGVYPSIYGAYINWQRMIRKDGYKLILYPRAEKMELFDLNNDPKELKDLSNDPSFAERRNQLFDDLIALQQEMGDDLDLTKVFNKELMK